MIRGLIVAFAAALAGLAAPAPAAPAKPLFAGEDMIHVTLTGPFGTFRTAREDSTAVDGTLAVTGGGTAETLPVKLSVRGITRRRTDICQFPPLWVEFVQKPGPTSLFAGQHKLKLVTHCQNAADFQHYQLLEYAAYKIYNALTPQSFRARLATIDYVDPAGKTMTHIGFFLEDAGDVAKRNDLVQAKVGDRILVATLDPPAAARYAVFEYLIANLDWALNGGPAGTHCCHNTRLIAATKDATTGYTPVPYDFDFSGMVDAPYAQPPEKVQVPNVRTRYYRGFCRYNAEATAAAADMVSKRATLLAVLDTIPQLDDKSKKKAQAFLAAGFDRMAADKVPSNLLATCL